LIHGLTLRGDVRLLARERAAMAQSPSAAPAMAAAPTAVPPGAPTLAAASASLAATEGRQYRREDHSPMPAGSSLALETKLRPAYALAVIDGGDGRVGAALVAALRAAFPGAMLWPMGLNAAAQVAMLEGLMDEPPAVPGDALSLVAGILAPSDVMIPGALDGEVTMRLVEALSTSPAKIVLLPPRDQRLRWVAAPIWPMERWVENAVIEAGNILDAASQ
jgi:hypothetical protein